eukprot:scaffold393634_cov19-Prasinocladus_malaysianus.AAC.1
MPRWACYAGRTPPAFRQHSARHHSSGLCNRDGNSMLPAYLLDSCIFLPVVYASCASSNSRQQVNEISVGQP